jgi:hypothetical protein
MLVATASMARSVVDQPRVDGSPRHLTDKLQLLICLNYKIFTCSSVT